MKKKSLLLSSLAMLVVAVIAFTGATYAWFISGNEPSVEQFEVGVVQSSVVKIGAKKQSSIVQATGENDYYFELPFNTLKNINGGAANGTHGWYHNPNDFSSYTLLDAVTPAVNSTTKKLEVDGGNRVLFNKEPVATRTNPGVDPAEYSYAYSSDEVNFITFDLFFINLHAEKFANVAFDADLTKIFIDSTKPYAADLTPAQRELILSTRMAFVTYTSGGAVDKQVIWEPYKGVPLTTATAGLDAGVQGPIEYVSDTPAKGSTLTPAYTSQVNANRNMLHLLTLSPYAGVWANSTRLTVYVWIEGNDPRCVSLASGGMFSVLLQFATELGDVDATAALANRKTSAKLELDAYVSGLDQGDFADWSAAQTAIAGIVSTRKTAIDGAATIDAINTLLDAALDDIDALKIP